jgi:hypothetical protein
MGWLLWSVLLLIVALHWKEQYRTAEDMTMYEADYEDKTQLLRLCYLKQPFIFTSPISTVKTPLEQWDGILAGAVDASGTDAPWTSENNEFFIQQNTPLLYDFRCLDRLWRPPWGLAHSSFDVWTGSVEATTPLSMHFNSLRFLYVAAGAVDIKLLPFSNTPYTNAAIDETRMVFASTVNLWKQDPLTQRIQSVDFSATEGQVVYLPPYWWYTIQYKATNTQIFVFQYSTAINIVAHLHLWWRRLKKTQPYII